MKPSRAWAYLLPELGVPLRVRIVGPVADHGDRRCTPGRQRPSVRRAVDPLRQPADDHDTGRGQLVAESGRRVPTTPGGVPGSDDADAAAMRTTLGVIETVVNVQEFTSSGTWTKPEQGTVAFVQIWGSGGGGASYSNGRAGGGGGGGYSTAFLRLADLGATETVTIGAGGFGGQGLGGYGGFGGAGGGTGGLASTPPVDEEGGCGCRQAGASRPNLRAAGLAFGWLGLVLLGYRRLGRRRGPR